MKKNVFRALSAFFILTSLFLSALVSCDNASNSNDLAVAIILAQQAAAAKQKQQEAAQSQGAAPAAGGQGAAPEQAGQAPGQAGAQEQTICVKGCIYSSAGAMPRTFSALASYSTALAGAAGVPAGAVSMSARPSPVDTGHYSFVYAERTDGQAGSYSIGKSPEDQAKFSVEGGALAFTLPLAAGKWKITAGVKKDNGGDESADTTVLSDFFEKTLTADDPIVSHVFLAVPTKSGSGSIKLAVSVSTSPSAVADTVKVSCSDENWKAAAGGETVSVALSGGSAEVSVASIKSGTYDTVFSFYKGSVLVYASPQTLNVFDNMETDAWLPDGSDLISGSGVFSVSMELAQKFVTPVIYVGVPAGSATSGENAVTASDSNSGGPGDPLGHLQAAFDKIAAGGSATTDYRILVSGSVTGAETGDANISASIVAPGSTGANARTITIEGISGLDGDGRPTDAVNGSGSGSVLTISSAVPVTVRNIKITGGHTGASAKGAGIRANAGTTLMIESGAWITGNEADERGGGVSSAGTLVMTGGEISGNTAKQLGGGLFVESDNSSPIEANISGSAIISGNRALGSSETWACFGGGLYVGQYATVKMTGGQIKENNAARGGGGVRISGSSAKFELSDKGKITGNTAEQGGGIDDDAAFEMTGGEISGNTADRGGAVNLNASYIDNGGGTGTYSFASFKIGGSPTIPCPSGEDGKKTPGNNDVFACRAFKDAADGGQYPAVQIMSRGFDFPSGTKVLAITPDGWRRGLDILKAADGTEINSYKDYFETTAQDFGFKQRSGDANKNIAMLKADLYVSPRGTDEGSNDGTKAKPYRSIQRAIEKLSSPGEPETIYVDCKKDDGTFAAVYVGKSEGTRTLNCINDFALQSSNCSELTICGVNGFDTNGAPKDFLDNQTGMTGVYQSTVYVSSTIPVTFKKLLIKGGSVGTEIGSDRCGAGLCVKKENGSSTAPVVKLAEGAMVSGNRLSDSDSTKGGGVYVGPGASLFIYGSAWIGDKKQALVTGKTPASVAGASNSAKLGGGLYNDGNVYIGYTGKNGSTLVPATGADAFTGGVSNNYSGAEGGGIYNNGTLEIAGGEICYNGSSNYVSDSAAGVGGGVQHAGGSLKISGGQIYANAATKGGGLHVAASSAELTDNGIIGHDALAKGNAAKNGDSEAFGGGVYIAAGKTFEMKGGYLKGNDATTYGGGVYIAGTFKMSGGTLSGNNIQNEDGGGCGVYDAGTFYISGSAYVPSNNDVYLPSEDNLVNISGSLSPTGGVTVGALKTPGLKRGTKVLSGTISGVTSVETNAPYFKPAVEGFDIFANDSNKAQGVIDTEFIYVASGADSDSSKRWGTQTQPYKYIKEAVEQCWNSDKDFKIKVSGEIKNGKPEEIPAKDETAKTGFAKSITIEGLNGIDSTSGEPKDSINRGLTKATAATTASTYAGNALIIANTSPIVIKNLKITGGAYKGGKGGGICASSAKVYDITLDNGALVCGNYAYYGGGVYVNGKDASNRSTFVMKGTARVGENQANYQGGGVYALKTKFYMSGSALIGKKTFWNCRNKLCKF